MRRCDVSTTLSDQRKLQVWEQDARDSSHEEFKVESADSVLARCLEAITLAERAFVDADIILISHGDALQILQTAFCGVSTAHHRSLPHLETCELRRLDKISPRRSVNTNTLE